MLKTVEEDKRAPYRDYFNRVPVDPFSFHLKTHVAPGTTVAIGSWQKNGQRTGENPPNLPFFPQKSFDPV